MESSWDVPNFRRQVVFVNSDGYDLRFVFFFLSSNGRQRISRWSRRVWAWEGSWGPQGEGTREREGEARG